MIITAIIDLIIFAAIAFEEIQHFLAQIIMVDFPAALIIVHIAIIVTVTAIQPISAILEIIIATTITEMETTIIRILASPMTTATDNGL